MFSFPRSRNTRRKEGSNDRSRLASLNPFSEARQKSSGGATRIIASPHDTMVSEVESDAVSTTTDTSSVFSGPYRRDSTDSSGSNKTEVVIRRRGPAVEDREDPTEALANLLAAIRPGRRAPFSGITVSSGQSDSGFMDTESGRSMDPLADLAERLGLTDLRDALEGKMGGGQRPSKRYQIQEEWSTLHIAAANGRLKQVKALTAKGASIDAKEDDGWTPLMLASQNGHVEVMHELLACGADVNHQGDEGVTALRQAAQNGHWEAVELLLAHGADPNKLTERGNSTLHIAVVNMMERKSELDQRKQLRILRALVQAGANLEAKDKDGDTPLHLACIAGSLECANLLLGSQVAVNVENLTGRSPLSYAAYESHLEITKLLLHKGADPNLREKKQWTPLHLCAQYDKEHTLETIQALVNAGADVNARTENNATALHLVAQTGNVDILRYLLSCGAHVNAKTSGGRTPLIQATANNHFEAAEALIAGGADVNIAEDGIGLTALHIAVSEKNAALVKLLLKNGADVHAQIRLQKRTVLHIASQLDDDDIFMLLLEHGAKP